MLSLFLPVTPPCTDRPDNEHYTPKQPASVASTYILSIGWSICPMSMSPGFLTRNLRLDLDSCFLPTLVSFVYYHYYHHTHSRLSSHPFQIPACVSKTGTFLLVYSHMDAETRPTSLIYSHYRFYIVSDYDFTLCPVCSARKAL